MGPHEVPLTFEKKRDTVARATEMPLEPCPVHLQSCRSVSSTYLDLQNAQNNGPYTAYTLYFGILSHYLGHLGRSRYLNIYEALVPETDCCGRLKAACRIHELHKTDVPISFRLRQYSFRHLAVCMFSVRWLLSSGACMQRAFRGERTSSRALRLRH